jgi:hypothetical protein
VASEGSPLQETDFLTGGGELGERIRLHDWAATPVGALCDWPQPLRLAVSLCVSSQFPILIHWGWLDLIVLYNDAFIPLIGEKHPKALGTRLFESWPELRPTIEGNSPQTVWYKVKNPAYTQAEGRGDLFHKPR